MIGATVLNGSNFLLERRVNQPADAVARTLRDRSAIAPADGFALDGGARLLVDETPRPSPRPILPNHQSWRTTARLSDRGRLVARLDVEVSAWAPASVLIQLRPLGRTKYWSARRTRRYFDLAHAAADRLERLLNQDCTVCV